jgi:mRNA-degrading endonuclease RelE of RelBE toxin-antitoxin system
VAYRVFIDKAAEKDIDRLPKNIRNLVLEEIKELAKDPRKPRAEPLEGKLKPYWKTHRTGTYLIQSPPTNCARHLSMDRLAVLSRPLEVGRARIDLNDVARDTSGRLK